MKTCIYSGKHNERRCHKRIQKAIGGIQSKSLYSWVCDRNYETDENRNKNVNKIENRKC